MTPAVECAGLTVAYGETVVLNELNLSVAPQEVVAILGASGSGKSTLLSTIAGFIDPRGGHVALLGRVVANARRSLPPESRNVAVVFQQAAIWPHMTALETVSYPLRRRGILVGEAEREAATLLTRVGLDGLAGRRPEQLSGGQQQRVGLARALARGAGLYLFDEPTSQVDAPLRAALLQEVAEQRAEAGAAAIYATHDFEEALAIADRVALLRRGSIVQLGPPLEVYTCPVDLEAAALTGPAVVLSSPGRLHQQGVAVSISGRDVLVPGGRAVGCGDSEGVVLIRADWARLGGDLPGLVASSMFRGPHTDYRVATDAGVVHIRETGPPTARAGERVTWDLQRAWLVPPPTA